jgi:hypothetical protein
VTLKPQARLILSLLRGFPEGLTQLEALNAGAGMRLGARVWELRHAGYPVETTWETTPAGARIARYVLRNEDEQLRLAV